MLGVHFLSCSLDARNDSALTAEVLIQSSFFDGSRASACCNWTEQPTMVMRMISLLALDDVLRILDTFTISPPIC